MRFKTHKHSPDEIIIKGKERFRELKSSGKINNDSLVYDEAKEKWTTCRDYGYTRLLTNLGIESNVAHKLPFFLLFILGGSYVFFVANLVGWLLFDFTTWAWLFPIIILSPGWLVPLGRCESYTEVLIWMGIVIIISIFLSFGAYYGLGTQDLGFGPV